LRMVGLKLAYLVPVMFVVSLATFFILEAAPGDPAVTVAGVNADPAIVAEIRAELGLDQPVIQRYLDWLGGSRCRP
jgi:peptide/nickel transport system permease protein